jgi:hypothetical protein
MHHNKKNWKMKKAAKKIKIKPEARKTVAEKTASF